MIEGRKLESYVKATMDGEYTAMSVKQIRGLIWYAFDEIENFDDLSEPRIRRILRQWVDRGLAYRISIKGKGGKCGDQYLWILSGEPFGVEE